jgi:hypothetical protein
MKLRTAGTPTTFTAITQNLLKTFGPSETSSDPLSGLVIPDFSQVQLPDDFSDADRKRVIEQMTANYVATLASETAKASTPKLPKISYKDYETQHANDIKPIPNPIQDNADSFIAGLFQFRRAREQFRGWESATFISQYQATSLNNGSDADNDVSDPSKWQENKIDLFKDFERIDIDDLKAWAETVWNAPNATLESQDGQSPAYARKVFSEFLFGSMTPDLQKSIQNAITTARLWNDGPYVWATMIFRFFPSAVVLRTTILDKMKTITLADHKNDLSAYCAALLDMNAVIDTSSHSEELVKAFLTQTSMHPSDIIKNHFNYLGVQFFMNRDNRKSFESFLESADRLHTITTSPALPFAASTDAHNKTDQNIAALAGILKGQTGSMKKIVSAISQLDNKFKQQASFKGKQEHQTSRELARQKAMRLTPPSWMQEAPTDTSEVREFNGKAWYYCATCKRWSTTHSTDGTTHNGKSIPKHRPMSFSGDKKRRSDRTSFSPGSSKKTKNDSSQSIDGIKSLKAEITKQSNSSILDLIVKAAAGES